MLTVNNLSVRLGDHLVLDDISFTINRHDRLGLIGPNGSGKSTLLATLAGLRVPDIGYVSLMAGNTIGLLRQGFADLSQGTLRDLIDDQLGGLLETQERLERAFAQLGAGVSDTGERLGLLAAATEALEQRGGYDRVDQLERHLARFRLDAFPYETPLSRLSGGEKTRAGLAALLASKPDLLLLDEPTNHLDVDALEWLEKFVSEYDGAAVVVSHDRAFIDETVTSILELDDMRHTITPHSGNYSDYLVAKERLALAQMDAFERQQREIARIERDVRAVASHAQRTERATTNDFLRGRAKKVARTAKVRERKLDRLMESTEHIQRPERRWNMALEFATPVESGRDVIVADDLSLAFDDRTLFSNVELRVRAGERVAITGPNGAGKSSLFRIICGELQPTDGSVRLGTGVHPGYFSQEQDTVSMDQSPLAQIRAVALGDEGEARGFLHKFLFTSENVLRPAGELSYGERARLDLALLVRRGANLLLLDEPLNHLDLPSREQFEEALNAFEGTTMMVLHDRYAIARLATRVLLLRNGQLVER